VSLALSRARVGCHPRRSQRAWLASCACALSLFSAQRANAHAAPAAPPLFEADPCFTLVDLDQQQELSIPYAVPMDDAELTAGDIPLPDALTHQFLAFRGTFALQGFNPVYYRLDPDADHIPLPLWITWDDVQRAAKSSSDHFLGYEFSDATRDEVLESEPGFEGQWLRVTADDARVPITRAQSFRGVRWDLSQVEPGIYSIAGYIFSPPYNGWEARPGVVKLTRKGVNPPAAVLDRVQETLFGGQGRRVSACVDVPAGTRMRATANYEDMATHEWVPWGQEQTISTGRVDLCFVNPRPMQGGTVRVRLELTDPEGNVSAFYSPDTLTVLSGAQPCEESSTVCCPNGSGQPSEPVPMAKTAGAPAAGAPAQPMSAGMGAAPKEKGGCSVLTPRAGPAAWLWGVAWLGLSAARRRLGKRR
jgi:hypothetical protein